MRRTERFWRISITNRAKKKATVEIFETIGDPFEGTTAALFSKDLKALGDIDEIELIINSPGGSVFDALGIFEILNRHPATVNVVIAGLAASAATLIAMVGNNIEISANGIFMIHDPAGFAFGTAADMEKMAEALNKIRDAIIATYVNRTGGDRDEISQMMADETWMTAEEALDFGFVDSISQPVAVAAAHDLRVFNYRKDPPKQLPRNSNRGRKKGTRDVTVALQRNYALRAARHQRP